MRLYDPARPSKDGIGLWLSNPEDPSSARWGLPVIYVEPGAVEGQWELTINMPASSNAFTGFGAKLDDHAALSAFFARWLEDPEREIRETFRYEYNVHMRRDRGREKVRERTVASGLAALGLDDL